MSQDGASYEVARSDPASSVARTVDGTIPIARVAGSEASKRQQEPAESATLREGPDPRSQRGQSFADME